MRKEVYHDSSLYKNRKPRCISFQISFFSTIRKPWGTTQWNGYNKSHFPPRQLHHLSHILHQRKFPWVTIRVVSFSQNDKQVEQKKVLPIYLGLVHHTGTTVYGSAECARYLLWGQGHWQLPGTSEIQRSWYVSLASSMHRHLSYTVYGLLNTAEYGHTALCKENIQLKGPYPW